ncbi:MAG: hypothetical protein Q8S92_22735 [Hydrogenophaga sp.]|uniref:phage tail assembly chaperone n=1 Tax=Hydrogenophaga sp. TaxID=1904254 RepID=UPI0027369CFC|nr:hypothetical protein [Hydrogenophaga sp.]MDP3351812.1 hypothetical protein [Hydrogenophaga sp.]
MTEIEEGGQRYRLTRLDAMRQFHVSRKLAPIVPTLVPVFLKIARSEGLEDIASSAVLLQPFAEAIAGMNDTDAEYVLGTCLSVVQRQTTATSWAPVWSEKAKACMFDDVDMGVMVKLVLEVVKDSLGPFIRGLLTSLPEASPDSQPVGG